MNETTRNGLRKVLDVIGEENVELVVLVAAAHLLAGAGYALESASKVLQTLYYRKADVIDAPYKKNESSSNTGNSPVN